MLKKYQQILQKINEFDFSRFDDANLLNRFSSLKEKLIKNPNKAIPELLAIIREVIDRRLGIWNLFNSDIPSHLTTENIKRIFNEVKDKLPFIDKSKIHLKSEFYSEIRKLRKPDDNLTFMPFNVQLLGALALLDGKIAEMATGEGKTVVAVFPASIWALSGKKVHIATVNDYLALRDCLWMNPVYEFLGLKADCILSYMSDSERRNSYNADIVYGNNYEFGFDYLRDNLKNKLDERVQSDLDYVIIDEIDSILMDEAVTPLIISGSPVSNHNNYWIFKDIIESLIKKQKKIVDQLFNEYKIENDQFIKIIRLIQILIADPWNADLFDYLSENKDIIKKINDVWAKYISARSEYKLEQDLLYTIDEKNRTVKLTDKGITFAEELLGKGFFTFSDHPNSALIKVGKGICPNTPENIRNFLQLLRAYTLYRKDEDYIIHDGKIIIVDEYTGRLSYGKKYEEGLHQALECKEGLTITPENRVMG
ncbi:MAG: DEAD/DEAH box helicase, partial [Candidatus Poribacteria bacterium]